MDASPKIGEAPEQGHSMKKRWQAPEIHSLEEPLIQGGVLLHFLPESFHSTISNVGTFHLNGS
jgi:hypothetical protein